MQGLVFESTDTVTQAEFAEFVADRARHGDSSHYELLNGRIVMNPPAGYPHGEVGSNIQVAFGAFIRQNKLGKLFDSSQGYELPSGDTVEPDHSFVSNARWSAAPPPEEGRFLQVAPDLVVEVLSNRTASQDRGEKKAIYERNGVTEYWLVDWRARRVSVFQLQGDRYDGGTTFDENDDATSRVLQGLSVRVSDLMPA